MYKCRYTVEWVVLGVSTLIFESVIMYKNHQGPTVVKEHVNLLSIPHVLPNKTPTTVIPGGVTIAVLPGVLVSPMFPAPCVMHYIGDIVPNAQTDPIWKSNVRTLHPLCHETPFTLSATGRAYVEYVRPKLAKLYESATKESQTALFELAVVSTAGGLGVAQGVTLQSNPVLWTKFGKKANMVVSIPHCGLKNDETAALHVVGSIGQHPVIMETLSQLEQVSWNGASMDVSRAFYENLFAYLKGFGWDVKGFCSGLASSEQVGDVIVAKESKSSFWMYKQQWK